MRINKPKIESANKAKANKLSDILDYSIGEYVDLSIELGEVNRRYTGELKEHLPQIYDVLKMFAIEGVYNAIDVLHYLRGAATDDQNNFNFFLSICHPGEGLSLRSIIMQNKRKTVIQALQISIPRISHHIGRYDNYFVRINDRNE